MRSATWLATLFSTTPCEAMFGRRGYHAGVPPRVLIRDLAYADGTSASLQLGIGLLIEGSQIQWLGPAEEADTTNAEIIDGGGATLVPALVDAHSHLTGPGGSHWIERFSDPPDRLRQVARENACGRRSDHVTS